MTRRAFTLVELLVVISILGLLSTVAVVATNSSRITARNAKRKADLVQVSKALELYYADNGGYPNTGGISSWHGNCASFGSYPDTGAGAWIPGFQNYMAQLPHDSNTGIANAGSANAACRATPGFSCYLYTSNGIDYKLLSHCVPEGPWTSSDPFYDPGRPTHAWQVTNNQTVTGAW